ncbi:HTH_Tnp_Tc3_2 domain-containing protein [Trichonephila clavipes]|nr:HTH_Tnp_Tc3_2 domain-containing protein [Trichonephila clavipes]
MDGGQKTSDRTNYKRQLALTVLGERRLRRIVRRLQSQTLSQITTQLNVVVIRTAIKWTVQHLFHSMDFKSRQPMRLPLCNPHHRAARLAWQESTKIRVQRTRKK